MLFGNARPCKWATSTREHDQKAHLWTLAWVACEYDVPRIGGRYVEAPKGYVPYRFTDGRERIEHADRSWGTPFRAALNAWLELVNTTLDDESVQLRSRVAIWNNALECSDFCGWYGGDAKHVRFVLDHVEPEWSSKALREAYAWRDMTQRELVLLRAENHALRNKVTNVPIGWARYWEMGLGHKDTFERFLDVGHMLAYAAWTADWLSQQPKIERVLQEV